MIDPPEVVDGLGGDDSESVPTTQQHQHQQQGPNRTPQEIQQRRLHHLFAQNATEWLDVTDFATSEDCVAEVRRRGYQLWVTDLSQEAEPLDFPGTDGDAVGSSLSSSEPSPLPQKIALVMGTEAVGASQYILGEADKRVYLPLRGFADSLNLSVATALVLHHLFCLDPTLVGAMSDEERTQLRRAWYTKLCQQRILTSAQKKARTRLLGHIRKCQAIYEKTLRDPSHPLQPMEQKKLNEWPAYQKELDDLEALLESTRLEAAVQEWVNNPPEPLTDLRRADLHRVCYVGKNTRLKHKDHWKDMVATSNAGSIHGATATTIRERLHHEAAGATDAMTVVTATNDATEDPKETGAPTSRQSPTPATTEIATTPSSWIFSTT
jgi:tRNA(Leu) C34 or U34 (ribose-2'-O)-methylase TrmL